MVQQAEPFRQNPRGRPGGINIVLVLRTIVYNVVDFRDNGLKNS